MPGSLSAFGRTAAVIRAEWRFFAAVVAIGAAPGLVAFLILGEEQRVVTLIDALLLLYLQLLVTFRTLDAVGAMPADYERHHATEGRYMAAFLGSILSAIGIALASTLLIVPGILLLTLWSLWMPVLAAERRRVPAALARSWQLVRPHLGRVLILVMAVAGLWLVVIPASAVPNILGRDPNLRVVDTVGSVLLAMVQLFSAALWAVVYTELIRDAVPIDQGSGDLVAQD